MDAGRWLHPVGPRGEMPLSGLSADKRDVLVALTLLELAGLVNDLTSRQSIERSSAALLRSATEKIAAQVEP